MKIYKITSEQVKLLKAALERSSTIVQDFEMVVDNILYRNGPVDRDEEEIRAAEEAIMSAHRALEGLTALSPLELLAEQANG